MLKQRILTALVLIPLMLLMLFCSGSFLWAAFSALIALIALWEYGRLAGLNAQQQTHYLGGTAFFMLTAYLGNWQLPSLIWLISLGFWLIAMPIWLHQKWKISANAQGFALGWLLMIPFWFALIQLRPNSDYAAHLLAVMILVWLADSAAYFVGCAIGKHKLAPVLSPKKLGRCDWWLGCRADLCNLRAIARLVICWSILVGGNVGFCDFDVCEHWRRFAGKLAETCGWD